MMQLICIDCLSFGHDRRDFGLVESNFLKEFKIMGRTKVSEWWTICVWAV